MSKLALTNGNYTYISPTATNRSEIISEIKKSFKGMRAKEKKFFDSLFTREVCAETFRVTYGQARIGAFKCTLDVGHDGEHGLIAKNLSKKSNNA